MTVILLLDAISRIAICNHQSSSSNDDDDDDDDDIPWITLDYLGTSNLLPSLNL